MQKIIVLLSAVAVSFIAGYFSYPYINAIDSKAKTTGTAFLESASELLIAKEMDVSSVANTDDQQELAKISNEISKRSDVELVDVIEETVSLGDEKLSDEYTEKMADKTVAISTSEVKAIETWQEEHKQNLSETIKANVPDSIAQGLLDKVFDDNAFLDEVVSEKDMLKDEAWAQQMQQRISDAIQTHELSNKVEVFLIACKQSTCDLTGRSAELGTWQQMSIGIITLLFAEGYQLNMEASKNVSFLEEGQEYFYSQFVFK